MTKLLIKYNDAYICEKYRNELDFINIPMYYPNNKAFSNLSIFITLFSTGLLSQDYSSERKLIEEEVAKLIFKHGIEKKCVVTSFDWENILRMRQAAPELETGYLTGVVDETTLLKMQAVGCVELCPEATLVTPDRVREWHEKGFRVRAWGIKDESLMRCVYDSGADGMTVNFPDKLTAYMGKTER